MKRAVQHCAEINVSLPTSETIHLAVYDALGREVARLHDGPLPAGRRSFVIEGDRLPAGAYLVRAEGASFRAVQLFSLLR
ncbi:MAG: hypothetical protein IH855_03485 [Bacteroidetes bacterium]|nr:hypothetical protein [Bacteroidota bacterium]